MFLFQFVFDNILVNVEYNVKMLFKYVVLVSYGDLEKVFFINVKCLKEDNVLMMFFLCVVILNEKDNLIVFFGVFIIYIGEK